MSMSMSIHGCAHMRINHIFPSNDNSVTLEIITDQDEKIEITLYGLSEDVTDKLTSLHDDGTDNYDDRSDDDDL